MRRCPHCTCELTPVEYEGFVVHRCAQCNGHLVSSSRLDAIKHLGQRPKDELKAEAAAEFRGSRPERIRCPRCHMVMRKEAIRLPVLAVQMDVCRDCALVWFDGGELALAQLGHEATAQFVSAQELKRRMAELESSPERRAAFERNLARQRETKVNHGDTEARRRQCTEARERQPRPAWPDESAVLSRCGLEGRSDESNSSSSPHNRRANVARPRSGLATFASPRPP